MSDSRLENQETSLATDAYEAPQLIAIGNLRDLLAATSGSQCDASGLPTSGAEMALCE